MDLLEEFKKIVAHYLDAPDIFIEAAAYHIVSAVLGRFFHCSFIPGGQYGARPNVWSKPQRITDDICRADYFVDHN